MALVYIIFGIVIVYWLTILLLSIFKWDWLSEHPILFENWRMWGLFGEDLRTPKYDPDIRKRTITIALLWITAGIFLIVFMALL